MSIRRDHPELWAELAAAAREVVGLGWTDDEIAAVMNKVRAPEPGLLLDHIGDVLAWCAAAQSSGDDEAIAHVELWKTPGLPVAIKVQDDGRITHRLEPD